MAAPEKYISSLPYSYSVEVPQMLAGAVFTGFITIQPDSHFLARQRVVKRLGASGPSSTEDGQFIVSSTVEISDMASGRAFMREPVRICNIFGRGLFPFKIPLGGKVFYKRQVIQVRVENINTFSSAGFVLEWQGEKIFTTS